MIMMSFKSEFSELELNRMVRTDLFNVIVHRGKHVGLYDTTPEEQRILFGKVNIEESKLFKRSLTTRELVFGQHDHRMMAIGITEFPP